MLKANLLFLVSEVHHQFESTEISLRKTLCENYAAHDRTMFFSCKHVKNEKRVALELKLCAETGEVSLYSFMYLSK